MAKIYRVELHSTLTDFAFDAVSTFHYQTDIAVGEDEQSPGAILDHISDHFSSSGHNWIDFTKFMYSASKLTRAVLREEVQDPGVDIPDTAEEALDLAGGLTFGTNDKTPPPACVWFNTRTGVALRSARGGFHGPPPVNAANLTSSGQWTTGTTWWNDQVALGEKYVSPIIDFDTFGSDLLPVIYSRTRRARNVSPFTFQVETCVPTVKVRWLRRRETAP